jgi:hypothetical protein
VILFAIGFLSGAFSTYVILDLLQASRTSKFDERILACTKELAESHTLRTLDHYSNDQIIRAIADGLDLNKKPV